VFSNLIETRRKMMTTPALFTHARNEPMLQADGSINFEIYRKIAMAERRKALRQFWSWISAEVKPHSAGPVASRYAARLG
jgi:hypothetical protein